MKRWLISVVASASCLLFAGIRNTVTAQSPASDPHAGPVFATSDNCLACHNGLIAPTGEDVSIGTSWQASMMANAARDPYWHAAVRRETIDHPSRRAHIEDECAICHMPMARTSARAAGGQGQVFALLPTLHGTSQEQQLAADGVSCSLCHQISTERLGTRESFVGGFVIAPADERGPRMMAPLEVDNRLAAVMRSATGATPAQGRHLQESEVCATCHTLYTEAFGSSGEVIGTLPEQVPYLEWRHSAFATERSCQGCHMPAAESTPIASVLGQPRERLSRHAFTGGNFFMLRMLGRYRDELAVPAPSHDLEAAAQATLRNLATETASAEIVRTALLDGRLDVDVAVRNLTGHKLPTGYPSRRVWLHLTARDASGRVVFESGAVTPTGRIVGNDNDDDGGRAEPHYEVVRSGDQVQIYESLMARPDGRLTTGLLQATQYVKDNRLLPRGFDKGSAQADIAVIGGAATDADFTSDGDRVRYSIDASTVQAPVTIDVELRYQPISFRWAENLRAYDGDEVRRFRGYYDSMASGSSAVLAQTRTTDR